MKITRLKPGNARGVTFDGAICAAAYGARAMGRAIGQRKVDYATLSRQAIHLDQLEILQRIYRHPSRLRKLVKKLGKPLKLLTAWQAQQLIMKHAIGRQGAQAAKQKKPTAPKTFLRRAIKP